MFSSLFEKLEGALRGAIYLLIVVMGLALASLGAYVITMLCWRLAQFLHANVFRQWG